ncbi:hypothetical protein JL721_3866 [Aureococcus anophagefferens]|nr:hypothetical protein JL721_3866 [Aureococcus anophagefferens]
MTSVAARAATQDELAFLSEFLEPTTGDDSSEESDAELDCSAPAPRSPPPRGGGVAMRQVTRAELRYVLDDAAAPEPERAWSGEAEELSDGDDAPVDAALLARLEASTTERINLTLGAGDYVASGAAAAVDAFLAPRVDWAVEREPWGGRGGPLVLARARADTAAGAVYRDLATLWRDAQWSGGCGRAQSLGGNNPWGPIVDIWARNAWAAWSRGATFVPPSLRGWYLAAPADDAFCAGAASQWACHFLPLSACDEIAESGEDDDARFVRVFSRGNVTVCRGGCDDAALRAAGLAGPPDPRLAAIFAGARGAADGVAPHDLVGALLQRGVALRPSYRVRHLARPPAVEGPCVFAQIRHGSKTSPQWLARHKTASFFVDLADYAREARALAPPGQAFTLFVATDDADALRDAPRLDAEDLRVVAAPSSFGAESSEAFWTGGRATSMHRGPAELARILATLEAAAAACGGFVGNCASVFVRRVDAALLALRLAPYRSFSFGPRSCLLDKATDAALGRTCVSSCRNATACALAGPGQHACAPAPAPLAGPGRFKARAAALGLDVAARRLSDAPRVGRGHSTSAKERRKRSHEKALPPPPPWLDPRAVAGPLFSPLNATEICAVKEVRKRPGIPGCEKGGPASAYPRAFVAPGDAYGARPVVGDDRWLARALSEARRNASRVFRVLVVGGSPAAGEGCVDARVSPPYAYAKPPKTHGSSSECSWASRLARYLEALLLPRGNFRIANVARGGASSAYFLAGADALFRRPADLLPEGTSTPPLADDVDLVLLAFTANDFALGCAEPATCFGAPAARGLGAYFPPGGAPTVAFVDTASSGSRGRLRTSRARTFLSATALAVAAPLVESMFWNGGTFRDEAEQRRAAAFLNAYLAPALRVALDAMMGPASWKGFGHYGAAYHEWVAATVFYALVAPAAEREHGAAQARRRRFVFDAGPNRGALVGSPDGWLHGEDVPGKSGWVTCDGGGTVSFRVECAAGDVVVGFLQSHDRRMGVANVTVAQGAAVRSFLVASWDRRPRSVYATKALTGLAAGGAVVSLRVLDGNQRAGPAGNASCPTFLAAPDCCHRDKFKLLSLACT